MKIKMEVQFLLLRVCMLFLIFSFSVIIVGFFNP